MEKEVKFKDATLLRKVAYEYSEIEDSYIIIRFMPGDRFPSRSAESKPLKLDGGAYMLIFAGKIEISLNSEKYEAGGGTAIGIHPGTQVIFKSDDWNSVDAYIVYFTSKFMQDLNISFSAISVPAMLQIDSPLLRLTHDEIDKLTRIMELLYLNAKDNDNAHINKLIASSLASAMFYQMLQSFYNRMTDIRQDSASQGRITYVQEFFRLLHSHYVSERSVGFYASKLFISPKYLSLLVREVTGRSAARWIDQFVIMEAKNLLRYSGKNIQQVAYALNFSNQSSFGKYFKHLTGMSPTEYQKR